jgi:hypothetical protein
MKKLMNISPILMNSFSHNDNGINVQPQDAIGSDKIYMR